MYGNFTCPTCEAQIYRLDIRAVQAGDQSSGQSFQAVVFGCSSCNAAIGATINPLALVAEIVRQVNKKSK
jgi:hypothetical protein